MPNWRGHLFSLKPWERAAKKVNGSLSFLINANVISGGAFSAYNQRSLETQNCSVTSWNLALSSSMFLKINMKLTNIFKKEYDFFFKTNQSYKKINHI